MPLQLSAPLLFDGAFGTYYLTVTGDRAPCELGNLTNSEAVLKIHKAYVAAGAQAIKTNTFVANPVQIPDPQKLRRVITAGWRGRPPLPPRCRSTPISAATTPRRRRRTT